ncbi:aminotransferase-like domain-containing protein [Spirochaeta lutea]|uniref:Aminotransferase class I/classII large domain-containing protein n=1 Tax=Spirochaeta lutea TaxID=1480694 RepID=A0A098QVM7_9SPIO|nr:PLP-dependent aminotransferase family protein [Spirochaeta lutea]KGE71448.1 hypothetical protein DC28_11725 [Spirochaeta lutea]
MKKESFKYLEIARALETMIEQWRRGETAHRPPRAFPSIRQTAREWSVSPNTVVQAYGVLESQGLIRGVERSGWQLIPPGEGVRRLAVPGVSKALEPRGAELSLLMENAMDAARSSAGIPLGIAAPGADLIPQSQLSGLLRRQTAREEAWGYDFAPGRRSLRAQIAQLMIRLGTGIPAEAGHILMTRGATEGLYLALSAVTSPGDLLLTESPCFSGYLVLARQLGLRILPLPTHPETGLDPRGLEEPISRHSGHACLLVSPNYANPLGSLMPWEHRTRIAELCRQGDIPVIENDVAGLIRFEGPVTPSLSSLVSRGVYLSSFSKTVGPGLRLGWVHSTGQMFEAMTARSVAQSTGGSALMALMMEDFLGSGGFYRHLYRLRREAQERRNTMIHALNRVLPRGSRITRPRGGLVLWIELPQGSDTMVLQRLARDQGITIAPGAIFSAHGEYASCIRLGYGAASPGQIRRGVEILGRLIHLQREEPV